MKQFFYTILYQPLYNILILFVWLIPGHNVGLAIIILTFLIRLALLPSANKALHSQQKMRVLQPKMDEIRKNYKGQEQATKLMELYKEHNFSPTGSCLPLVIQLPILIVLYQVFRNGLNTSHFNVLYSFMPRPEMINTHFLWMDLTKPDKWVLPIVTAALQYYQLLQIQKITGQDKVKRNEDGKMDMASAMSKQMLILTPVMTFLFALRFPAALPLYWFATTAFTILQQWWFARDNPTVAVEPVGVMGGNKSQITKAENKITPIKPAKKTKLLGSIKRSKDVVVTVRRKGE